MAITTFLDPNKPYSEFFSWLDDDRKETSSTAVSYKDIMDAKKRLDTSKILPA